MLKDIKYLKYASYGYPGVPKEIVLYFSEGKIEYSYGFSDAHLHDGVFVDKLQDTLPQLRRCVL